MSVFKALRGMGAAAGVAISLLPAMASGAIAASPVFICVGEKTGSEVTSGGAKGSCRPKEKLVALPSESAEQQTLLSILPHIKYVASGVGGKPTIQFSGVNAQVVNGEGNTATTNGEGNLVIGYDEHIFRPDRAETGSHNLILGSEQEFTSYGGLVAGRENSIIGPFVSISGGSFNRAL